MNEPEPSAEAPEASGPRKHVLAAALDEVTEGKLQPVLSRAEFELSRVPSVRSAETILRLIPFQVVMTDFAIAADDLGRLAELLADPASPSCSAHLLLFAPPEQLTDAEELLGRGVTQVLSTALEPFALQEAVLALLRARIRLAMRVMARLTVRLESGSPQLLCQTRDLSRTGMLAITDSRYPVGTPVRFALDLPGSVDPVRGEAEVVRHASRRLDKVDGLGLRFLDFSADGLRRLVAFLALYGA